MDRVLAVSTFIAMLGSGLMAGVFFAFSVFVMRTLKRLPHAQAIAAMQAINVAVIHPLFLGVFLGTAVLCCGIIVAALLRSTPNSVYQIVGGLLYVLGTFLVTMVCNVPLNNLLAATPPAAPASEQVWADYVRRWNRWNHVRTAAALAATAALALAGCSS